MSSSETTSRGPTVETFDLVRLDEPTLLFGHNQATEDPRDGLSLFGPLDRGKTYGIRAAVVGTESGIREFRAWVNRIQRPVLTGAEQLGRPPFPGFEAVFGIPWSPDPLIQIEVPDSELTASLYLSDQHQRVYRTVDAYSRRILDSLRTDDERADVWFVIIPDNVYKYCRPRSRVEAALRIESESTLSPQEARALQSQPSLFAADNLAAVPYSYEVNFHNQLKARLLGHDAPTQIVRESTIAGEGSGTKRNAGFLQSQLAWNMSTATFYKTGARPWKISSIRDGVCYVGLVFKSDEKQADPRSSCCAAQMFLDSGDGLVFKGAVGPWHTPGKGEYHLTRAAANELVAMAVDAYSKLHGGPPTELFIHGKVRFNNEEWLGFQSAVPSSTKLVGVRIRTDDILKLYRMGRHPVLRGLAYIRDQRTAYLWTRGFTPRLQTFPGNEVPRPLLVDVCRGDIAIEVVLADIMGLTKLNYNSCRYSDGDPVTLTFADAVGEILTAGPVGTSAPLPFKYYI